MSDRICVLCAHYRPNSETHLPDRGQTCALGRRRLEHELLNLRAGYLRLLELQDVEVGAKDAVGRRLPAASLPGASRQPQVSGTRDRRIPLTDVADLTAAAQVGTVRDPYRDQVGRLSVATVINEWVRCWHGRYFHNQSRPAPAAVTLIDWLAGVRLELICDAEPAIADFAAELYDLRRAVRRHLGESTPARQPMWGVPCPRCGLVSQLMLDPDDPDRYRECANCAELMIEAEYHIYLRELVDQYRADQRLARGA